MIRPSSQYRPPPAHVCEVVEQLADLGTGLDRLAMRQNVYKGRVVDFAFVVESRRDEADSWHPIYRIDCSHGEVHEHLFPEADNDRRVIQVIPPGHHGSWDLVDSLADEMLDRVHDSWPELRRRWDTP